MIVPDHFCRGYRPRSVEPCNSTPCPPTWVTGDWSGCSMSCGEGVQTRNVTCRISRYEKPGSVTCNEETQPATTQPCNTGIACPDDSEPIPDIDEALPLLHPYPPFRPTAEKLVGEQMSPSSEPNWLVDDGKGLEMGAVSEWLMAQRRTITKYGHAHD
ncbi:peptidase activity protein [Homalodisca vitripennis]|nr:peptidase activity protein [Homalodisca vitripennis]